METLFVSTCVVALAEIGDKTQLLALLLAVRYRKPAPIIAGILVATLLNHALAGLAGAWIADALDPAWLRYALGASFLAMAVWVLVPDRIDDDEAPAATRHGVFLATLGAFFVAEIGDKTQLATVALAAHYAAPIAVVAGTTLGMLIADVPAVLAGRHVGTRLPMKAMHAIAAAVFALLGVATLAWGG